MNEEIEIKYPTPTADRLIEAEINRALLRHGVSLTSAVKADIQEHLQVGSVCGQTVISVHDDRDRLLTLDDYLAELKNDPKYARDFPNVPQISAIDEAKLRTNFEKIARGQVAVVDEM